MWIESNADRNQVVTSSAIIIRELAEANHSQIYSLFEKTRIGVSEYGKLMDAAAKGRGVMAHRLFGHHPICDFPIDNLSNAPDFILHELSDVFTCQGLPIVPGETLKSAKLLKACDKLKASDSWGLVNAFDILTGTVAIYGGLYKCKASFSEQYSIETLPELARDIGIGGIELAFALSTCNPFLLLGAALTLTAGIRALVTDAASMYFTAATNSLTIQLAIDDISMANIAEHYTIDTAVSRLEIDNYTNSIMNNSTFKE